MSEHSTELNALKRFYPNTFFNFVKCDKLTKVVINVGKKYRAFNYVNEDNAGSSRPQAMQKLARAAIHDLQIESSKAQDD